MEPTPLTSSSAFFPECFSIPENFISVSEVFLRLRPSDRFLLSLCVFFLWLCFLDVGKAWRRYHKKKTIPLGGPTRSPTLLEIRTLPSFQRVFLQQDTGNSFSYATGELSAGLLCLFPHVPPEQRGIFTKLGQAGTSSCS